VAERERNIGFGREQNVYAYRSSCVYFVGCVLAQQNGHQLMYKTNALDLSLMKETSFKIS